MVSDNDLSAIAIVGGAAIGAAALFATTWFSYYAQERARLVAQNIVRREELYGEFIDEAARLYSDALTHELGDPSKLVRLYATISKMRLSAPDHVLAKADEIIARLIALYRAPKTGFDLSRALPKLDDMDLLRTFGNACRDDLRHLAHAPRKRRHYTAMTNMPSDAAPGSGLTRTADQVRMSNSA